MVKGNSLVCGCIFKLEIFISNNFEVVKEFSMFSVVYDIFIV